MARSERENVQLTNGTPADPTVGGGTRAASPPTRRPRRRGIGWPARLEIALMSGPTLLVFVFFVIFPVAGAAYDGVFSWQGDGPATDFVGLDNYTMIFEAGTLLDALQHNAAIVVPPLALHGPVAVLLALLL